MTAVQALQQIKRVQLPNEGVCLVVRTETGLLNWACESIAEAAQIACFVVLIGERPLGIYSDGCLVHDEYTVSRLSRESAVY